MNLPAYNKQSRRKATDRESLRRCSFSLDQWMAPQQQTPQLHFPVLVVCREDNLSIQNSKVEYQRVYLSRDMSG